MGGKNKKTVENGIHRNGLTMNGAKKRHMSLQVNLRYAVKCPSPYLRAFLASPFHAIAK
jgi:hypothetical protein